MQPDISHKCRKAGLGDPRRQCGPVLRKRKRGLPSFYTLRLTARSRSLRFMIAHSDPAPLPAADSLKASSSLKGCPAMGPPPQASAAAPQVVERELMAIADRHRSAGYEAMRSNLKAVSTLIGGGKVTVCDVVHNCVFELCVIDNNPVALGMPTVLPSPSWTSPRINSAARALGLRMPSRPVLRPATERPGCGSTGGRVRRTGRRKEDHLRVCAVQGVHTSHKNWRRVGRGACHVPVASSASVTCVCFAPIPRVLESQQQTLDRYHTQLPRFHGAEWGHYSPPGAHLIGRTKTRPHQAARRVVTKRGQGNRNGSVALT